MNLIRKARALASRQNARVIAPRAFTPPYGGGSYYGPAHHWNQVLHYKFWTFVAINALKKEIAGGDEPIIGKVRSRDKKTKYIPVRKSLGGPKPHQEFEPYDDDHPITRLFANPNGPDVCYDLWAYDTLFHHLCGSSHWWVIKNDWNVPVEIWVIPTHWMRLSTARDGTPDNWMVQSPWGQVQRIPYNDVVSFYEHSPLNRYEGYAVSNAIGEWIDVYEAMTRTRLATFKNGAVPSFHVALGDSYSDPDEAFLTRFYAKWFQRFQGEDNAGRPLITGADVDVKSLGISPRDIGFETGDDQIRDNTLAAYGVPKGVVGIEPASDTSAYAPHNQFVRFTIAPYLRYKAAVITEKIIKPVDSDGVMYWPDRTVNDPEREERQLQWDVSNGVRTINEARALRGLAPYPHGGDDPLVNNAPVPWVSGKRQAPDDEMEAAMIQQASVNNRNSDDPVHELPQANGFHPQRLRLGRV